MVTRASAFSPFVVAYGDEDFYLDRDIERACQGKRSVLQINAEDGFTDSALIALCETHFEEPRTIIIDNAQKVKGAKKLTAFIEHHDGADRSIILVAIVRNNKLPDVWALAASKGKIVKRNKIKPWDTESYINFINIEADRVQVRIGQDIAKVLFQYVGTDLYRLENELRKLSIFVGQSRAVAKEDITLVVSPTPKAEPFEVAEQVVAKNLRRALGLFSILYRNSGDDCLIPVVRSLMKQVEKMVIIRSLQDKGGVDEAEIAAAVNMKEWPYKNIAAPNARKHDFKSLAGHMGRLCKLDVDVKGSARSKRTMVELAILSIAQ